MAAFKFRMTAGFSGDVNRSHPASIIPYLNDPDSPVPFFGSAAMFNGADNDVRAITTTDESATAIAVAGFAVRPYPFQQRTGGDSAAIGSGAPPEGAIDILDQGFILVPTVGVPNLGDPVYIWCAASDATHTQGGAEAAATGGSTALLANCSFNGPPDSTGLCEIKVNH